MNPSLKCNGGAGTIQLRQHSTGSWPPRGRCPGNSSVGIATAALLATATPGWRQRCRVNGRARPGARLAPLQSRCLCRAAGDGRGGEGRTLGRAVSGAMGLVRWTWRQCATGRETTARHHRPSTGGAKLFLPATSNLIPDHLMRRSQLVPAELLMGREARPRQGRHSV